MTDSTQSQRTGAPATAYVALVLGLAALATLAWPPLPIVLGGVGFAAALHARSIIRRDPQSTGTVASLLGATLSVVGLATATPWAVGLIILATAPR